MPYVNERNSDKKIVNYQEGETIFSKVGTVCRQQVLNGLIEISFLISLYVIALQAVAQPMLSEKAETAKFPVNVGWYPETVNFAPDESNFIVTVCPDPYVKRDRLQCKILRYDIRGDRWENLPDLNADASYGDVAYTWTGDAIFAQEYAPCTSPPPSQPTRQSCNKLVLLDLNGKKIKELTSDPFNTYLYPSLTQDGKRVLYWGVSNQLQGGMGGGAWDVKELDVATQRTVQKTDYQAAFPKVTPRYMPDGKRLMLTAEDYPKRPNDADFFVTHERTGRSFRTDYTGKFGRNMTVVIEGPRDPVRPYFPTLKKVEKDGQVLWEPVDDHMWLIVRDVSRDGKLAVFDRRGVGTCFRFLNEPLRHEECFSKVSLSMSASIAPSNSAVISVVGDARPSVSWSVQWLDVKTGKAWIIGLPR